MDMDNALKIIDDYQLTAYAYFHASTLLEHDGITAAPGASVEGRAITLSVMAKAARDALVNPELSKALDFLNENMSELDFVRKRMVEEISNSFRNAVAVPEKVAMEYVKLKAEAGAAWEKAKAEDDFAAYAPYLEQLVEMWKLLAQYRGPGMDPYELHMGDYEKGSNIRQLNAFFAKIGEQLTPLIKEIGKAPNKPDVSFLNGSFPVEKQRELSEYLFALLGADRGRCTFATSAHPCTNMMNQKDVRFTTKYNEHNPLVGMYVTMHELGHSIYCTKYNERFNYTVLNDSMSWSMHESQSRFFENMIGRSQQFIEFILPKMQELFPQLNRVSPTAFYQAVNKSEPSLIRLEADELTYPLHIMIRYEIEKMLFENKVQVKELPELWNSLYFAYLGITPPSNKLGILQDMHWAVGWIGYFPSYALGSAYAAQFYNTLTKTMDVPTLLANGQIKPIVDFFEKNLYSMGKTYSTDAALNIITGESFNPDYYIAYLTDKYRKLYS